MSMFQKLLLVTGMLLVVTLTTNIFLVLTRVGYQSDIATYQEDLDYLIRQGYVYTVTVLDGDTKYTELIYSGPIWTNAIKDTTYTISIFNEVEEVYDPVKRVIQLESYCID